jgi:hypothetical protein
LTSRTGQSIIIHRAAISNFVCLLRASRASIAFEGRRLIRGLISSAANFNQSTIAIVVAKLSR